MAEQSPIVPSDLDPITSGLLACDALRELLATREKVQTFLEWMLQNDTSGNLGDDFKLAIRNQLLFDALKKGWFVRSNPSTGYLELVEFIPLAGLDASGSEEGDTLTVVDGVWVTTPKPEIYLAPSVGGTNPPAATAGGLSSVAHGLGATPSVFGAFLECTSADRGYAVGDTVDASGLVFFNSVSTESMHATSIFANSTIVGCVFRNGGASSEYQLHDKGTFARDDIDITKWAVKFYAAL